MNDAVKAPPALDPPVEGATGPETPFPLRLVEEALCRDCPFPMQPEWPADVMASWNKWQKEFLKTVQTKAVEKPYSELIGKTLEVLHPGGPGAKMIADSNRIVITIDERDHITHVSPPTVLFPGEIKLPLDGASVLGGL